MKIKNFDNCVSFHIENGAYRGRFVRLGEILNVILGKHKAPNPVSAVIAESTTLATILASTLKYDGLFTLQTQSNGPVSVVVVDVTSEGKVRATAKYDEAHLNKSQGLRKMTGEIEPALHLMGLGTLAFTVDQGKNAELYQGVVELKGNALVDSAKRYFKQSEQIETSIKLFLKPPVGESTSWLAAGIMLQKMPTEGGSLDIQQDDANESWNEACVFLESLTEDEVFNADLSSEEILNRLYHSSKLVVSSSTDYEFSCRCSREKLCATLGAFSSEEVEDMAEDGKINVTCQFCSEEYVFDKSELVKH